MKAKDPAKCFQHAEEAFLMARNELMNLDSTKEFKPLIPVLERICKQNAVISRLYAAQKIHVSLMMCVKKFKKIEIKKETIFPFFVVLFASIHKHI